MTETYFYKNILYFQSFDYFQQEHQPQQSQPGLRLQRLREQEWRDEMTDAMMNMMKPKYHKPPRNPRSRAGPLLTDNNHCNLCLSNRETEQIYMGHRLRDEDGKVGSYFLQIIS